MYNPLARCLRARFSSSEMAPLYRKAVEAFGWPAEEAMLKVKTPAGAWKASRGSCLKDASKKKPRGHAFLQEMEAAHKAELEALEEKLADARENYGDVEERDCLLEKAHFFCRIGNAVRSETQRMQPFRGLLELKLVQGAAVL